MRFFYSNKMAGIYIHIPFCKVKCNYCDFHFSTNQKYLSKMTQAICTELADRKGYLDNEAIKTIYFGGGTPSILPDNDLKSIVDTIKSNYQLEQNLEFTFEANPDDLSEQKLIELKRVGINRLSIGIQSFDNDQLVFMNRAHNAEEANNCVQLAQKHGFDNITIDLIYGLPNTDEVYWKSQVSKAINLGVNHISAYCLTIEDKTVFGNWHKKGKLNPLGDEAGLKQFKILQSELKKAGYEHYEISNFSKDGNISQHNSAYWLGEKYLGIGPSAHSFNGNFRQWNVANNIRYIRALEDKSTYFEYEKLTQTDKFNEYILTRLRTKWGIHLDELFLISDVNKREIDTKISQFISNGDLQELDKVVTLTQQGKFIADYISSELFI